MGISLRRINRGCLLFLHDHVINSVLFFLCKDNMGQHLLLIPQNDVIRLLPLILKQKVPVSKAC